MTRTKTLYCDCHNTENQFGFKVLPDIELITVYVRDYQKKGQFVSIGHYCPCCLSFYMKDCQYPVQDSDQWALYDGSVETLPK